MKEIYEKQVSLMQRFNQPVPPIPLHIAHLYPPGPNNPNHEKAMTTASVEVSVRAARGGNALPGVEVTLIDTDGARCTHCPQDTDENGQATLELDMSNIPVGQGSYRGHTLYYLSTFFRASSDRRQKETSP